MKNGFSKFLLLLASALAMHAAQAQVTPDEAIAMVKEAEQSVAKNGKEKVIADINNPKGPFIKGELYLVMAKTDGTVLAHGGNPKLIGKNIAEIKDTDGRMFFQEQVKLVKGKGSGWMDFNWPNPVTKAIERKSVYLLKLDDGTFLSGGIYKK